MRNNSQPIACTGRGPTACHPRAARRNALAPGLLPGLLLGLLLALCLAAGAAQAQAEPRYYQLEVVIFTHPEGSSLEQPLRRRTAPVDEVAEADTAAAAGAASEFSDFSEAESSPPLPASFAPAVQPVELGAVAARLNRGGYTLLWHQAWVQPPVQPPRDSDGVPLDVLAAFGQGPATPELSGRLSFSQRRFLHLGLQLELQSPTGLYARLDQQRRIRPGAEHYFDHPRIGVIVLVRDVTGQVQGAEVPGDDTQSPAAP